MVIIQEGSQDAAVAVEGGVVQCGEAAGGGGIKEWLLRIVHDEINYTNRMMAVVEGVVEVEGVVVVVLMVEAVQEKVVAVESGYECGSRISGWKSGRGSSNRGSSNGGTW